MNNYAFWEDYLKTCIKKIKKICETKKQLKIDLHIHSNYSADSDQKLEEIINRNTKLNFDIIAITDHDSVKVYDELYDYLINNKKTNLIIVPGIEFTIDNKDYGNQFHILQLFINPKSNEIINNIKYQEEACKNRSIKQLYRLNHNKAIKYFMKKYGMKFTIEGYEKYLSKLRIPIYEYKTIMEYIKISFDKNNITNWDILKKMKFYNLRDDCIERKNIKIELFKKYEEKYKDYQDSDYNFRFFHNLLAMRGMDDDFYKEYKMVGDLSVNNFNELKLDEINRKYLTVFAHPSENRLDLLNDLLKINNNVLGMELNKRCKYMQEKLFYNKLKELDMLLIKGSDSHDIDNDLYDDIDFYNIDSVEILKIIKKIEELYE